MLRDLCILAVVTACVLGSALGSGLFLDDVYRVQDNPGIQRFWSPLRHFVDPGTMSTAQHLRQYRPLLPLTLSIDYALAGDSTAGYHAGNLLLHLLAVFAVYLLAREILTHHAPQRGPPAATTALFVALLFAVHPVSGIPVNYVSARDLTLMQLFLLASLLLYLRMRRLGATPARWGAVLGCALLSLLGKKNAAVLPLLVVLIEVLFPIPSLRPLHRAARALPFGALVAAVFAWIAWGVGFSDAANVVQAGSAWDYARGQLQHHVFHYLRNFVWPLPIRVLPEDPVTSYGPWIGALVCAAALGLAWSLRRRAPAAAFGILAYAILMLPTSSVVPFHAQIVAYRPYPGSPFLFLAAALGLARVTRPRVAAFIGVAALLYFATCSVILSRTWRDAESLYGHAIAYGTNASAYCNLAQRQRDPARRRALLEAAVALNPDHADANVGLGLEQVRAGDCPGGLDRIRRGIQLAPGRASNHDWLSWACRQCGDMPSAADAARRAMELDPRNPKYLALAGTTAALTGRHRFAIESLERLLRDFPDSGYERSAHRSLALAYENVGDPAAAARHRAAGR